MSKFLGKDDDITISQCSDCVHWTAFFGPRCTAFPEAIPDEILTNEVSHTKPYEGDGGFQYEKRTE